MNKRGQISSQVFIFIVAVLIIGLIVLFGYQSISSARKRGEQVLLIQFKTQLMEDIETHTSYGAFGVEKYQFPSGFDEMCFVDLEHVAAADIINHRIIKDSVESNTKQNLFLFGKNNFEAFYVEGLRLSRWPFYSCVQSGAKNIELKIEGKGDAAVVLTPPSEKYCQAAQDAEICNGLDVGFGSGYKNECCNEYSLCCL